MTLIKNFYQTSSFIIDMWESIEFIGSLNESDCVSTPYSVYLKTKRTNESETGTRGHESMLRINYCEDLIKSIANLKLKMLDFLKMLLKIIEVIKTNKILKNL